MSEHYKPARSLDQLRRMAGAPVGDASPTAPEAMVLGGATLGRRNEAHTWMVEHYREYPNPQQLAQAASIKYSIEVEHIIRAARQMYDSVDGPRDPFETGRRGSMGYPKGEAERERLRGEIKRVEEKIALHRQRGEEVIAEQLTNNALKKYKAELADVKGDSLDPSQVIINLRREIERLRDQTRTSEMNGAAVEQRIGALELRIKELQTA